MESGHGRIIVQAGCDALRHIGQRKRVWKNVQGQIFGKIAAIWVGRHLFSYLNPLQGNGFGAFTL